MSACKCAVQFVVQQFILLDGNLQDQSGSIFSALEGTASAGSGQKDSSSSTGPGVTTPLPCFGSIYVLMC